METSRPFEERETADCEAPAVVGAFLKRYLDDVATGGARSLAAYQNAFPGFEAVIAREFAQLAAGEQNIDGGIEEWSTLGHDTLLGQSPDPDLLAVEIPGFELRAVLGRGGMGVVFEAEERGAIRRRVALKVIKLGMDTREVVARFESERQALALMNHPNIARVFDAGATPQGRPYFAMELVSGMPLTGFCDEHRLRVSARLKLFLEVCEAVQHAHQRGIIHRDLKPSNILAQRRQGEFEIKVIDFGIAKSTGQQLTDRSLQTQIGQVVGTPLYMSPEQAELGGLDIDTRSDVYSLGVILYELLTGHLPLGEDAAGRGDYTELIRQISEEDPPLPSTRVRAVTEVEDVARRRGTTRRGLKRILRGDLNWIVVKALEKDRARRYASVSEFAEDIRRHLRREPVLAGPPGTIYRLKKLASRQRIPLALAGAALLVVVATSWIWIRYDRERRETHYREAEMAREDYGRAEQSIADLERALDEARAPPSYPVWKRGDELRIWQELRRAKRELPTLLERVQVEFAQAASERAESSLKSFYQELQQRARRSKAGRLGPEFFDGLIQARNPGAGASTSESIRFEIDPPPDTVHCFRYVFVEGRLCPLPFDPRLGREDPARGIVGSPVLEVERIWPPSEGWEGTQPPLRPGDRLVAVNSAEVRGLADLVGALETVDSAEALSVDLLREGEGRTVEWTPYRRKDGEPRSGQEPLKMLGVTFSSFPLTLDERCRVDSALEGSQLRLTLPPGSYLLLLAKAAYSDARVPVHVPLLPGQEEEAAQRIHLVRTEDIPPGFVHVPGGIFGFGADEERVDQSLDFGYQNVESFFMKKYEVTFRDYLEFLNDVASHLEPRDVDRLLPRHAKQNGDIVTFVKRDGGKWVPYRKKFASELADWPVLGLSLQAKKEYIAWLNSRSEGRWRFRFPTDLEWEKAARGVDRRLYVWGDYFVPTFSTAPFADEVKRPEPIGSYPHDESVYGIRDLAGSASEPTSDLIRETGEKLISHRGGNWYTLNDYFFLIANRNGIKPENARGGDAGLRLVAERVLTTETETESEADDS